MGGVFDVDYYLKDTNFGFDPEAAHIVLSSGANYHPHSNGRNHTNYNDLPTFESHKRN